MLRPAALVAAAGVAAAAAFDQAGLFVLAAVFVLVVPFEKLFPRHRQPLRRPQVGTDMAHAVVSAPLNVVAIAVGLVLGLVSLAWIPGLALQPVVGALPPVAQFLLGVVLFDVAIYWTHRFGHEVPFLWRFHSIHHSTEHLDWVSGFRNHPFDGVFLAPAFVLLVVAGFSPELVGALAVVQIVTGLFLHANVRWIWRPLHKVIITPEFHHWHHANEPAAHNSNYSVFLPIWDLMFGTYFMPTGQRPQRYGVSETVPSGLVAHLWHPFRGLRSPLTFLRHPSHSGREVFRLVRRGLQQMRKSAQRTPWCPPWRGARRGELVSF